MRLANDENCAQLHAKKLHTRSLESQLITLAAQSSDNLTPYRRSLRSQLQAIPSDMLLYDTTHLTGASYPNNLMLGP
jgi:hypothetical protein